MRRGDKCRVCWCLCNVGVWWKWRTAKSFMPPKFATSLWSRIFSHQPLPDMIWIAKGVWYIRGLSPTWDASGCSSWASLRGQHPRRGQTDSGSHWKCCRAMNHGICVGDYKLLWGGLNAPTKNEHNNSHTCLFTEVCSFGCFTHACFKYFHHKSIRAEMIVKLLERGNFRLFVAEGLKNWHPGLILQLAITQAVNLRRWHKKCFVSCNQWAPLLGERGISVSIMVFNSHSARTKVTN